MVIWTELPEIRLLQPGVTALGNHRRVRRTTQSPRLMQPEVTVLGTHHRVRHTTQIPRLLQPEGKFLGISCRARACDRRVRPWIPVQNIDRRPRADIKTENVKKEVRIAELNRRWNGSGDERETFPGWYGGFHINS